MKDMVPCVCRGCKKLRERERFPRLPNGDRRNLCEFCIADALAPKHCKGCATLIRLEHYPLRQNGKPSSLCSACHVAKKNKLCTTCKENKPHSSFFLYGNGSRSRTCDPCRLQNMAVKICVKCSRALPATEFHRYRGNNLSASCEKCRRADVKRKQPSHKAPQPCAACGGEIRRNMPPSRVNTLKTCSRACSYRVRHTEIRQCRRCRKKLPYTDFDTLQNHANRRTSCRACVAKDTEIIDGKPKLRPSLQQFRANLSAYALRYGLSFSLTRHQAKKLYDEPCGLCGKAITTVQLHDKSLGIVPDNCRPVCTTCRVLMHTYSWAELVLVANEIAARHPLNG